MKFLKFNSKKSKAQAMVEFAIVLPILLLVVYGLIEVGRLIFMVASVNNATRQAARYGSTSGIGPNGVPRYQDCAGIRSAAQNSDFLNAFDDDDIQVWLDPGPDVDEDPLNWTEYCEAGFTTDSIAPSQGDRIIVTIGANFDTIVPLVPIDPQTIDAESSRTLLLSISIAPPKEDTETIITSDAPDASEIGGYVTVSVTVTYDTIPPTGTVTITGADENCTITLAAADNGEGSCVVRFTSLGTKELSATYAGDTKHNGSSDTETHTVDPATTITTITSDTPDPSLVDQNVTVSVTVSSTWGTPTGTVDITGADTNCTITLSGGSGSCSVSFASIGSKLITANYNGGTQHAASANSETHNVVVPGTTTTAITGDTPDPSIVGQNVTVSVAVTGTTTPTGTVTITGADTNCSITLSGGTGSCTVVFNTTGNKTITATYNGDATHSGSSDTEAHSVGQPATITTITVDEPDPSVAGQAVNVGVTVTGGSTTPTGTVTITGADTNCTINLVNGSGSCNVTFNTGGDKTLTATYNGDGTHGASSDTEAHTVETTVPYQCVHSHGPLLISSTGDTMSMTITNGSGVEFTVSQITVYWNHDTGRTGDKDLELNSGTLGSQFWSGKVTQPNYTISTFTNPPLTIPLGPSTITFKFKFNYAKQDGTERILIILSTPGCGAYPIDSDVISNPN